MQPTPKDVLRFEADPEIERREAKLRVALAAMVLFACAWLFAWPVWPLRIVAGMSAAFALVWLQRALRTLRETPVPEVPDHLELAPDALREVVRGQTRRVEWPEVAAVRIDEDRLAIVLDLHSGAEVELPPRYPGVPLRELGEAIARFHTRFRAAPGAAPS